MRWWFKDTDCADASAYSASCSATCSDITSSADDCYLDRDGFIRFRVSYQRGNRKHIERAE